MTARSQVLPARVLPALLLAAIVVVGFALRMWRLGDVPFGFHPDEGHNALDALAIAQGWRPVFLPGNNGREPMFMYVMALMLQIAGPSIWAARLTGVVAGTLVIPAMYVLARSLPLPGARRVALLAAALAATTFWPVSQARFALRAGLLPVWVALMLWAWWRALATVPGTVLAAVPGTVLAAVPDTVLAAVPDTVLAAVPDTVVPAPAPPLRQRLHLPWRSHRSAGIPQSPGRERQGAPRPLFSASLAGVLLAGAAYTHLTGRLLPLVLLLSAVWVAWRQRRRAPLAALVVALATAGILASPLAVYFARHPEMMSYRADQVSVLNPDVNEGDLVGLLARNGWRLLRTPVLQGDASWYHNLSRRPVFDPLVGAAFMVGLALFGRDLAGRRGQQAQALAVLLGATLVVTLVPSWLSVGAPNYVRLTGTWPVLFLTAAYGLERTGAFAGRRVGAFAGREVGTRAGTAVVVLAIGAGAVITTRQYFRVYAARPEVYTAFNGAAVERGLLVADLVREGPTYVSPPIWRQSVIRFLNAEHPPRSFDLSSGLVLPPSGHAHYAFDTSEPDAEARFDATFPGTLQRRTIQDRRGAASLYVASTRSSAEPLTRVPPFTDPSRTDPLQLPVTFGDRIALHGATTPSNPARPGDTVAVTLYFRAVAPTAVDHNLFVHVETSDGRSIGQFDGPPLAGSYGTDRWAPGEWIVQPVAVRLAGGAPVGEAEVRVGWYDWRTGVRLSVPGDDDAAVVAGSIRITE